MVVSNIGVVPDFSALYTTNAGPYTATIQVALKDEHQVEQLRIHGSGAERIGESISRISATFFSSGSMVDAILNIGHAGAD